MSLSNNFPTTPPSLNLDFANVKALDPRVTFTRSTTATYYDGVTVAMAEQNLVLQSQTFDNASWTKVSSFSVTANTTVAPDGTTTADTVTSTNGIAQAMYQDVAVSVGLVYTYSFWMYKTTSTTDGQFAGISLEFRTSGGAAVAEYGANINSDAGALIAPSGWATAGFASSSIVSDGNYWKITVTTVAAPATSAVVRVWHSASGYYLNGTRATGITASKIIWGAQLEQRSSGTAYTATTTQPITNYIPVLQTAASGIPRFDHNPTTSESLGLLIEEQRTNICIRSEDFSASGWTRVNATVSANVGIAPDGTQTADLLIPNSTSSADHSVYRLNGTLTGTYTASCYAKAAGYNFVEVFDGTGANRLRVNLTDGSYTIVGSPAAVSVTAVGNGWYRCSFTRAISSALQYVQIGAISDSAGSAFSGNGFGGVLIWGAQQELGDFPTSYIATTTAAATRNADDASMTGTNFSSWYDAGEGSLFTEADIIGTPSLSITVELGSASYTNRMALFGDLYNGAYFIVDTNGVRQATINAGSYSFNTMFRLSGSYKVNDFAASINNATAATDTSGTIPVITTAYLGYQGGGGGYLNGHLRRVAYYPARLTNAQLQALTS